MPPLPCPATGVVTRRRRQAQGSGMVVCLQRVNSLLQPGLLVLLYSRSAAAAGALGGGQMSAADSQLPNFAPLRGFGAAAASAEPR